MTLQTVKLSQLRLSPLNVRRVKPKAIDQLAADIAAHGLLQNLVVYAEGNRFEVAAGKIKSLLNVIISSLVISASVFLL